MAAVDLINSPTVFPMFWPITAESSDAAGLIWAKASRAISLLCHSDCITSAEGAAMVELINPMSGSLGETVAVPTLPVWVAGKLNVNESSSVLS